MFMEKYLVKNNVEVWNKAEGFHLLKTCPLCSTRIEDNGDCAPSCPGHRNHGERVKHLMFIRPDIFKKKTRKIKVKNKW